MKAFLNRLLEGDWPFATAFAQGTAEAASPHWRAVADPIRPKVPKRPP